jgi:hypothetical protein
VTSPLFEAIGRVHPRILGRWLPLNGAGVSGAALADLGLPLEVLRGIHSTHPERARCDVSRGAPSRRRDWPYLP